ncbi:MAG: hypothetical protein ACFB12_28060 [Leptolyngbyaceae cyanobacterium]
MKPFNRDDVLLQREPSKVASNAGNSASFLQDFSQTSLGTLRVMGDSENLILRSPLKQHSPKVIEKRPVAVPAIAEIASYLIKLYVHDHEPLFGKEEGSGFELNEIGQIASDEWLRAVQAHPTLSIDRWLLLPNRLEGIINIRESFVAGNYGGLGNKPRLLSSFVASYKAAVAKRINLLRNSPGSTIWERSYQERFIPDEAMLNRVRQALQK